MTTVNLKIDEYTNRVLGVIKERFGLKDKGEALRLFAGMFGENFVEKEVKDEVVAEIIDSCNAHVKKHGLRKMSEKELDALCGIE
jgi:hypothetical protein